MLIHHLSPPRFCSLLPIEYETLLDENRLYSREYSFADSPSIQKQACLRIIHLCVIWIYEFASRRFAYGSRTRKRWSLEKMEAAIARRRKRIELLTVPWSVARKREITWRWWVKARVALELEGLPRRPWPWMHPRAAAIQQVGWVVRWDAHQRLSPRLVCLAPLEINSVLSSASAGKLCQASGQEIHRSRRDRSRFSVDY